LAGVGEEAAVVEVVLVVLTVVAVAAAMAMAPGRLRRARGDRFALPPPRRTAHRSRQAFLGVCASCLEMLETDERLSACPTCGGELSVRRRIRSGEPARSGTPAAR
jgi:hypothetical protein